MRASFFALCTLAVAGFGCAVHTTDASEGDDDTEAAEGAVSASSTSTYVTVRPDFRRCISPICGGYYVSRLNFSTIKCADGKWASECYVADIDWSKTGLPAVQADALAPTTLVIRGEIGKKAWGSFGELGQLKASEAWTPAVSEVTATGTYYRVEDNGVRCIKAPCFSTDANKLNSTVSRKLSSLDGTYAEKVAGLLGSQKVIVAGTVHEVKGGGRSLSVTQFWTRVTVDPLACSVDADCTFSAYTKPVTSSGECYCARCATSPINVDVATDNAESWTKYCSSKPMMCPMVMCIRPPAVACVANQCTRSAEI